MNALSSLALLAILSANGDGTPTRSAGAPLPAPDVNLLQFVSQQCQYCQAMQPVLAQLAQQGFKIESVDVDRDRPVANQYQVRGVPTYIAVSGGREISRIEGVTTADMLAALVQGLERRGQGTGDRGQGARDGGQGEAAARAATVRIKVEDATGYGFGTGTIIDTHDNEALVITCGHLFRESKGKGQITADLFTAGAAQTVPGQLIGYDLDRDVALISIRAPGVRAATIAPPGTIVRPGDRAFTLGCDKGADPSLRATQIKAINRYRGKPNYTAAGQPTDGRSGGGLFTAEGQLIGVCNAADPADDEGIYAGLASIHWQLDQIGQSEIYQRATRTAIAAATPSAGAPSTAAPSIAASAAAPPRDASLALTSAQSPAPVAPVAETRLPQPSSPQPMAPAAFAPPTSIDQSLGVAPVVAAGDDTEIVFIVRSKRDPAQRSEVYVVDGAAPDLIARITHAARTSGEQRAALARVPARPPIPAAPTNGLPGGGPIVRGQTAGY